MAKGLLSAGLALGRAAAAARVPLAAARLRAILASGASLRLQFPAEDLGFVYAGPGAAVVPDTVRRNNVSGAATPATGAPVILAMVCVPAALLFHVAEGCCRGSGCRRAFISF